MEDNQLQEFSLEDIIREFSNHPQEETAPAEETVEETAMEEPEQLEEPAQPETEEPPVTADTIRLEQLTEVTNDTIRLDKIPETKGRVTNAQKILEEEEEPVLEEEEKAEPYSEEWEPEYEQPIAEYVPPQPIIFQPRSRLRELKRQLVAGPEKQYYALSEKGVGKLQAAIFFSLLVVALSAVATVMYAAGLVPENRLRLMVFGQFLAMLVSALLGSFQMIEGVTDLIHKKFTLNTLLVFTFVVCCVDGVLCLNQLRIPCCAAFGLQVSMSLWSSYQHKIVRLGQLDTMRKATQLYSLGVEEEYFEEEKAFLRGEGQVEDFMNTYQQPCKLEKTISVYAVCAMGASVALGVVAGIFHGISTGVQVASVTALAAMPASMFITLSRPRAVLERRLHDLGAVLCGWEGVDGLSQKAMFPVEHEDLFPAGTVKMNGVKFFGSRLPDEIIAYAAALMEADSNNLSALFAHLLDSRNGMHYSVENYNAYENGGIGGEVNGEPVLAGSLAFLKEMGVEVPEGIRVSQAVCVAIDGELCGLFAVTYDKDKAASAGIGTLSCYSGLKPVLVTADLLLTPEFLRSKFGVKPKKLRMLSRSEFKQLQGKKLEEQATAYALATQPGLAPMAYAVTGSRALKKAAKMGLAVHMVGGILGVVMMLVLALLGATEYLTPANMFLFELVWMIPGLLITEWTRSV